MRACTSNELRFAQPALLSAGFVVKFACHSTQTHAACGAAHAVCELLPASAHLAVLMLVVPQLHMRAAYAPSQADMWP
jgi:hypothetical protein